MAGDEADLVFDVRRDPGEVLRRRVDAFRGPGSHARRRMLVIAGVTAVVGAFGGFVALWDPSVGGPLFFGAVISEGAFLLAWIGVGRPLLRERALARPFAHARYRLVASRSGVEYLADGTEFRIGWSHAIAVRDHDGGLVLVFDGDPTVIDIPPWCFVDDGARSRAKAQLAGWITATAVRW